MINRYLIIGYDKYIRRRAYCSFFSCDFDKTLLEKTSLLYGLSERETSRQRFENRLETSTRLFEIEDGGEVHENFHGRIDKTFPR